ncbi:MAG: MFS transporter [Acidobacteria bacterium RIFCSPLOWO2_02_FULL_65_29]|nr:MAG: MFS transporter [Acidobacteria bacterium RIFCSPLOWO2_02_FULL_65_29]
MPAVSTLDEETRHRQLVRAVVASTVGTTVEWYDFFLYGSAAALIFPKLFFSNVDPDLGSILSYITFFAGFAARPVGAAIFGHWGDRIGRKALLVTTMLVMGVSTTAIGLVPTDQSIGVWGAVLLTILRAMQGIAVGGEWSGSVLMAGEWAPPGRRGFTTSFPQMGAPLGMMMANSALSFMTSTLDEAAFLSWGWRVPFLASIVLIAIGLWIRIGILESPVFANIKAERKIVRAPIVETLKTNWREVVLTTLLRTGQLAPYYITTTYILTYGTQQLGMSRAVLLNCVIVRSIGSLVVLPLAGHLSDRFGRKRIIGAGCVGTGLWVFVLFAFLDTKSIPLIIVALLVDGMLQDLQYGPQAAIISESFPASRRYTGSGLGYHLAAITAGGPAPVIAAWLFRTYQTSTAISMFALGTTLVSLATLRFLQDKAGTLDRV